VCVSERLCVRACVWTSLVSAYCTLSVTSYGMDFSAFLCYRKMLIGYGSDDRRYSGWKSVDNYDMCGSVFVVLFNGFISLTSYFDVKYRY
jgi:hypothetical protein